MAYSSTLVANNVLARSFSERIPVNRAKLQRVVYFAAVAYQQATGRALLEEQWKTWAYGPVLYSVHNKFSCYGIRAIDAYAVHAGQRRARMVDEQGDVELRVALDRAWHYARPISAVQLSEIVRVPGSAWDSAYQRGALCLDGGEIGRDSALGVLRAAGAGAPLGAGCPRLSASSGG